MDNVQHFELPYRSRERAKKFYFDVFDWQLFDLPGSSYTLANSVTTHANGMPTRPGAINGGLVPRGEHLQGPTFMVHVGDLGSALDKIRRNGGTVLTEPTHMGPVVFARFQDSEGNVLAVFEDAPEKGAPAKAAPAKAPAAKPASKGLTSKQRAQRQSAARMRGVRARASASKGGKGPIAKRGTASKLRRQLGLKAGKAKAKASRKKR